MKRITSLSKTSRLFIVFPFLYLFLGAPAAFAQWSTNPAVNNAICTATDLQDIAQITTDGAGGAIITWYDFRNGTDYDIYAQRINAAGVVQWTTDGVVVCNDVEAQTGANIVSDGAGGAIITWGDLRDATDFHIYAQRLNASGVAQWTTNGVAICTAANSQALQGIASDGANGAIITWRDRRTAGGPKGGDLNIYAQRVNAFGVTQWTTDGVAICTQAANQDNPTIVADGAGGAIIAWDDTRNSDYDIYAQKVNASGVTQWTTNGIAISTATDDQLVAEAIADGAGGAIIAWIDRRNGTDYDIYAQQVDGTGSIGWTTNGVAVCTATGQQSHQTLDTDNSGGAIITWDDNRTSSNGDVYAQRISAGGAAQWTTDGEVICTESSEQRLPAIATDSSGSAIITWYDGRNGPTNIYAQRIDISGTVQWTADGIAISTAGEQYSPVIVSSCGGSAIITWTDIRNSNSDIYAQRVKADGTLGGCACPSENESLDARGIPLLTGSSNLAVKGMTAMVQPNPGNGYFNLVINSSDNGKPVSVRIVDVNGKVMSLYSKVAANSTLHINADKWTEGIYFAEIMQGAERKVIKLVRSN